MRHNQNESFRKWRYLINFSAFIFILGSAVVLHEFGHFIVAKLFKIRVETFSVGFGPRLFGKRWGHTDYRVSAIPLGGYVKLGGDESNAPLEGASAHGYSAPINVQLPAALAANIRCPRGPGNEHPDSIGDSFRGAIYVRRSSDTSAGRLLRFPGGAADQAGLQPAIESSRLTAKRIRRWDVLAATHCFRRVMLCRLVVNRNGARFISTLTAALAKPKMVSPQVLSISFLITVGCRSSLVTSGQHPAEESGLQAGDRFISIDGERVKSSEQVTPVHRES